MKRQYLLAALSGLLLFFSFPNILGLELWPLGWVALVPLLFALDRAESPRAAAKLATVTGLVAYPLTYHWLTHTFTVYAGMGLAISVTVLVLMVFVLSGFLALFGLVYHLLSKKTRLGFLAAPMAWVAIEYVRTWIPFGGFPWALLGYSQHKFLPVIQIAEFAGPYGVSFLVASTNAALVAAIYLMIEGKKKEAAKFASARILVPFGLLVFLGLVRMHQVETAFASQPSTVVGIVQANIDQGMKWNEDQFWKSMNAHMDLTKKILSKKPRLVIWPEAAITVGAFNEHWRRRTMVIDFLAGLDAYLLAGSISREPCGQRTCHFNSAYLLSPRCDDLLARYDKMHLVPFGEYVPLQKLLFFADAIARGNTGSTTPGSEIKLMSIPGLSFGCPICYEVIFPDQVRRFVKMGANFMTTITNDAWFGKTGAPYQHHAAVVFRAVENRVYFARAANTGVSSIVDPVGRVVHQTPIYEQASFAGEVKPSPIKTLYTAWGDWFAILVTTIAALLLGQLAGRKFRERSGRQRL